MAGNSKFAADIWLNYKLRGIAPPTPPSLSLAVFSVMPADDGTGGTEITVDFRATRLSLTGAFAAPTAKDANNEQVISSIIADLGNNNLSSTVTVAGFGFYDSATIGQGNMWSSGACTAPVQVAPNGDFYFAATALAEACD